MGNGRASPSDWATYASTTSTKAAHEVFRSSSLHKELDPREVVVRESRDSPSNPNSNALLLGLDMTGSMNVVLESIVKKDLGVLFEAIYDKRPISDPHILLSVFDDAEAGHRGPGCYQVGQFEAEIGPLTSQIDKMWLTRNGGGNSSESYHLPLYFAAKKTVIDCFEKRNKKGYLFTMGDEGVPPPLRTSQIMELFSIEEQADIPYDDCLRMAERTYEVFHIMIGEGSHMRRHKDVVVNEWTKVLGQRALLLEDHTKLGEVIVSTIEINEGRSLDDVAKAWSGDTSLVVRNTLKNLSKRGATGGDVIVTL